MKNNGLSPCRCTDRSRSKANNQTMFPWVADQRQHLPEPNFSMQTTPTLMSAAW